MYKQDESILDLISIESSIIDNLIKYMEDIDIHETICDNCSGTGCNLCNEKGYRDWIDEMRRPL